ncbi:MAG: hypothetical protein HKP30_07810 [Myxococcales bacterium]|nr:hypothetical protein [Myxococcales bacterium]
MHGQSLWDTVLHVPLVIHDPRRSDGGRRVAAQVRSVDVMPTLLEIAGLDPEAADGRSLLPMMAGRERADRPAYSELRVRETSQLRSATWRTGEHKLHLNAGLKNRRSLELYDVAEDPGETRDLALERAKQRSALDAELREWIGTIERRGSPWKRGTEIGDELQDRLRALGYGE